MGQSKKWCPRFILKNKTLFVNILIKFDIFLKIAYNSNDII